MYRKRRSRRYFDFDRFPLVRTCNRSERKIQSPRIIIIIITLIKRRLNLETGNVIQFSLPVSVSDIFVRRLSEKSCFSVRDLRPYISINIFARPKSTGGNYRNGRLAADVFLPFVNCRTFWRFVNSTAIPRTIFLAPDTY